MTTPEPPNAIEIAADLWQLPLQIHRHSLAAANGFLIRDHDGYVLFDCGADVPERVETIEPQLSRLAVPFDACHPLGLSHGHGDHAGMATRLTERSGARLALHELDVAFANFPNNGAADRELFISWLRRYGYPEPEIASPIESAAGRDRVD